jgi:putative addiction module killer protein
MVVGSRGSEGQGENCFTHERLGLGNPGDVKPVGVGVSEMRVPYGPGYRVYFKQTDKTIILLLCGRDKSTQEKDIKRAKEIAAEL